MRSFDSPSRPRSTLTLAGFTPAQLLAHLDQSRGFDPREVAEAKLGRLARFFAQQQLDAAVVGISGGVDSALVLGMLRTLELRGQLRRVVALLLPIEGQGATRQAEATERGHMVARAFGVDGWEAPLGESLASLVRALQDASWLPFTPWAEGQALSVMRTPALYGCAALLQAHGYRSVVVGTTNRDEGALLGFYGKASDGMVDVQPISDLHKSEVRALARHFGVPELVVNALPSGDLHDGRSDEQLIGASYDDVEVYLRLRELGRHELLGESPARSAIEQHCAQNQHKYRVGSPAVHLDVLPRGVPGGWPDEPFSPRTEQRPPDAALPGCWEPPPIALDAPTGLPAMRRLSVPGLAIQARDVLGAADCARLCDAMAASGRAEPVGVTGVRNSYGTGSLRATAFSPVLAAQLWRRLRPVVPSVRFLDERDPTDAFATATRTAHRSFRVVGLSPVLRFMRYEPGGRHLCHYDAGYDYGDGRRSLLSVVLYLTSAPDSGATRFVRDGQEQLPVAQRNFDDWSDEAREDQVLVSVQPEQGGALIFDHRLCHDVQRWDGPGERVIIRADVVYEVVPDGRA